MTKGPSPGSIGHHTSVTIGSSMYLYGGGDSEDVYELNLEADPHEWKILSTTGDHPGPLDEHTAVALKEKMIVFGGFARNGRTNSVWIFDTVK